MGAFDTLIRTLLADGNLGLDIVYRPATRAAVSCRAAFAQPDIEVSIGDSRIRDRNRVLIVRAADIACPACDDSVEIPAGGALYRVMDVRANDPARLAWRLEAAPCS